jgi:hypothetical protein
MQIRTCHTCKYVQICAYTCKYINTFRYIHIHSNLNTNNRTLYCTQPPTRGGDQAVMPTPRGCRTTTTTTTTKEVCRDMPLTLAGPLGHGPGRPGARGRAYNALNSRPRCGARQSGPGSSWAARASGQLELEGPASQPVTMTGRTGSESWGRSDVGEAVDIGNALRPPAAGTIMWTGRRGRWPGPGYDALSARPRRWANRFKFTVHPTRSLGWILCLQCQADSSSPDDACGRAFSALRARLPEADNVFRICCTRWPVAMQCSCT